MSTGWHPDTDATPTPADVDSIVEVLEGHHGVLAVEIAEFFSTKHCLAGDAGRSWAWAGVAERVRMRSRLRLNEKWCFTETGMHSTQSGQKDPTAYTTYQG